MAGLTSTMNANLSAMLRWIRQWPRVLVGVSFFVFFLSFSASTIQFNDKVPLGMTSVLTQRGITSTCQDSFTMGSRHRALIKTWPWSWPGTAFNAIQ